MTNQTMQAIRVHHYGGPEQLQLERAPRPQPRPREALVRLYATGVLPADWKMCAGVFHGVFPISFPYIPGSAFPGVVEAAGPEVPTVQPRQSVLGRRGKGDYGG